MVLSGGKGDGPGGNPTPSPGAFFPGFSYCLFFLYRVVCKVLHQDVFPNSILQARAEERRTKRMTLDNNSNNIAAAETISESIHN